MTMTCHSNGLVLGIDPGNNGGWCVLGDSIVATGLLWTREELSLPDMEVSFVCIEEQFIIHGRNQSGQSTRIFNCGRVFQACFERYGIEPVLVRAQTWQTSILRVHGASTRTERKAKSIALALQFGADLRPGKCRVDHDGIADAVNIARYGALIMKN